MPEPHLAGDGGSSVLPVGISGATPGSGTNLANHQTQPQLQSGESTANVSGNRTNRRKRRSNQQQGPSEPRVNPLAGQNPSQVFLNLYRRAATLPPDQLVSNRLEEPVEDSVERPVEKPVAELSQPNPRKRGARAGRQKKNYNRNLRRASLSSQSQPEETASATRASGPPRGGPSRRSKSKRAAFRGRTQRREELRVREEEALRVGPEPVIPEQPIVPEPDISEQPIVSEPNIPEQPIVTEPIIREQPIISEPFITQQPIVPEPVITQQPIVTERVILQELVVLQNPVVPEQPVVSEQPVVPEPTVVPESPVLPWQLVTMNVQYAEETKSQKLDRLRQESMVKIGRRIMINNGANGQIVEANGASVRALALARQPYVSQDPEENGMSLFATNSPAQGSQGTTEPIYVASGQENERNGVVRGRGQGRGRFVGRGRGRDRGQGSGFATRAEMRATQAERYGEDSNSDQASRTETSDEDSIAAMRDGVGLRKAVAEDAALAAPIWDGKGTEPALVDFEGGFMPAPIWDERPRFNKYLPHNEGGLIVWNRIDLDMSIFRRLDRNLLANPSLLPDGLDLVDATTTVNVNNAALYGYTTDEDRWIVRTNAFPLTARELTNDSMKLDPTDPENVLHKDECVEELTRNWRGHKKQQQDAAIRSRNAESRSLQLARKTMTPVAAAVPKRPKINIYVRPAKDEDVNQLTAIYNHYVKETVHSADLTPIQPAEIQLRLADAANEKLPFLVAIAKNVIKRGEAGAEMVVGWASATDCINSTSSERFSVELDVFVDPEHRRKGVGRCLLDRLMQATDRGHHSDVTYHFDCAQQHVHRYMAGGVRDLITLKFVVRSFEKAARGQAQEVDLPWIKKWLETKWKFEQQGFIKRSGVKFGRYVDSSIFIRSTAFQPQEHTMVE